MTFVQSAPPKTDTVLLSAYVIYTSVTTAKASTIIVTATLSIISTKLTTSIVTEKTTLLQLKRLLQL